YIDHNTACPEPPTATRTAPKRAVPKRTAPETDCAQNRLRTKQTAHKTAGGGEVPRRLQLPRNPLPLFRIFYEHELRTDFLIVMYAFYHVRKHVGRTENGDFGCIPVRTQRYGIGHNHLGQLTVPQVFV